MNNGTRNGILPKIAAGLAVLGVGGAAGVYAQSRENKTHSADNKERIARHAGLPGHPAMRERVSRLESKFESIEDKLDKIDEKLDKALDKR